MGIEVDKEFAEQVFERMKDEVDKKYEEFKEKYESRHPNKTFEEAARGSILRFIEKPLFKRTLFTSVKKEYLDSPFFKEYEGDVKDYIDNLVDEAYSKGE